MKYLPQLFENNRAWAEAQRSRDPHFFEKLAAVHGWIYGLADGLLRDLRMSPQRADQLERSYADAVDALQSERER